VDGFYQPPLPGRVVVVVELCSVVVLDWDVDVELSALESAETRVELGKPIYNKATAHNAPPARLIARRLVILDS